MVSEAERTGCDLAVACVMLEKETSGGRNIYGHDRTSCDDLPYEKGGPVTRQNYLAYKASRDVCGMQGVGPAQLTWWEYQDRADAAGGCWRPEINCRIGFELLASYLAANGGDFRAAFGQYNGGPRWRDDPGAVRYADHAMSLLPKWRAIVTERIDDG